MSEQDQKSASTARNLLGAGAAVAGMAVQSGRLPRWADRLITGLLAILTTAVGAQFLPPVPGPTAAQVVQVPAVSAEGVIECTPDQIASWRAAWVEWGRREALRKVAGDLRHAQGAEGVLNVVAGLVLELTVPPPVAMPAEVNP